MKTYILIISLMALQTSFARSPSNNKKETQPVSRESLLNNAQVVSEIQKEMANTNKLNKRRIYELLSTASHNLEKDFSLDQLTEVLRVFEQYNKLDQTHYYVEMFVDLYQKKQKDFEAAIKKALSPAQKTEFMRKLNIAITESKEGNG